jgi:hypothetical protein
MDIDWIGFMIVLFIILFIVSQSALIHCFWSRHRCRRSLEPDLRGPKTEPECAMDCMTACMTEN